MSLEQTQLESQFFEAQVYKEGKILGAPEEVIKFREELREKYVLNAPIGTGITYSVNLRPQIKDLTQQGWLVKPLKLKNQKFNLPL